MNIPFNLLLDPETLELRSDKELAKILLDAGIDIKKPTMHSCAAGVTACVTDLAMHILSSKDSAVYDGSFTEYVSANNF